MGKEAVKLYLKMKQFVTPQFDLNVFLDFFVYFGQKKYLKSYAQASGTIVYPQGPSSNLCGKTRLLCVFLWCPEQKAEWLKLLTSS